MHVLECGVVDDVAEGFFAQLAVADAGVAVDVGASGSALSLR